MTRAKKVQKQIGKQILGRINVWTIFRNLSKLHAMHRVDHVRGKHRIRQVVAQWRLETTIENEILGQNCSEGEPKTTVSVFYAHADVLLRSSRIFSCCITMTAMKFLFKVGRGATDLTLDRMKFPRDQVHCQVINSKPLKTAKESGLIKPW